MQFTTPLDISPKSFPKMDHTHTILSLGSCFSQHIGNKLEQAKFDCINNPYGILYNPASIAKALDEIIEGKNYVSEDVFFHAEQWHSWMHHGSFSSSNKQQVIQEINNKRESASIAINDLDYLLITFGSAWVYRLKQSNQVVSNCHKVISDNFIRQRLSVKEIVETYRILIYKLVKKSPKLKIIISVSPIRHVRDGLHENQLSKSILLLAIDELVKEFENIIYFPSYEIVLDELRDYRFYAEDMLHPSGVAIEYIWGKYQKVFFSKDTVSLITACLKIEKSLKHRPLNPNTQSYYSFLQDLIDKMNLISNKYPKLDFRKEIDTCRIPLKK
jgi:hypothetical protein